MMDTLRVCPMPRVDVGLVRSWFGELKGFPDTDLVEQIVSRGAPVPVSGDGDLPAALAYGMFD